VYRTRISSKKRRDRSVYEPWT